MIAVNAVMSAASMSKPSSRSAIVRFPVLETGMNSGEALDDAQEDRFEDRHEAGSLTSTNLKET